MRVAEAIAGTLAARGVEVCFGLLGSGNFAVANALRDAGAAFLSARHECGATMMADGYARASGRTGVVSVHQGPGFTNTLTGLTEAAKSRTPLLVLAADTPAQALWSNFKIDQGAVAATLGAIPERVRSPETAAEDAARALRRAGVERRPVVLNIPIDLVEKDVAGETGYAEPPVAERPYPSARAVERVTELIAAAERPVVLAGRGAALSAGARDALVGLADSVGALLTTSAVGNGLFAGHPYCVGISGGFSSPLAKELLGMADLVLAFGASLNRWTMSHGRLYAEDARFVQVDLDAEALGALHPVEVGVVGDVAATARALVDELNRRGVGGPGFRAGAPEISTRRWRDEPFDDASTDERLDPRSLSIALDGLLPQERTVSVDSGHFLGWPSMYLSVPDQQGFVFPQAFQSVGLGLGSGIGAAVARPDRLSVCAVGDGGALMALGELETAARYRLPMVVVVYNDAAYGAEVHHFGPMGHPVDLATFPDTDFAALAGAAGAEGITVRSVRDLASVEEWLGRRDGPLVVDAKVNPEVRAEWLEEAFRAH